MSELVSDSKNKSAVMQESCSRLLVSTQIRQECSWWMEKEVPVYLLGGRKKTQNECVWTADEVLHPSEENASPGAANGNEADPSRTLLNFPAVWLASRSVPWVLTLMRHRSLSITHAASHACSVIPCHTHTHKSRLTERQIPGVREPACSCKLNAA